MKIAVATLESVCPYSQSRFYGHEVAKLNKETADDFEKRTWRNKMHVTADGYVFIPPMSFKFSLDKAAKMLRMQIPGKGKSEYGKHFLSGVMVFDPLVLSLKAEDVPGEWVYCNADGKRGSGTRVMRCFPRIESWKGDVIFNLLDDTITKEVFEKHLQEDGKFVGVGRNRAENGGFYGRFKVAKVKWQESE